jgi:hypothetical protein
MERTERYVLIETQAPFDSADVDATYDLAKGLGDVADVSVFLAGNGVLATRKSSVAATRLTDLATSTTVWADDFSLRERGIRRDELVAGVVPAPMDRLVELVTAPGTKAIWH